MLVESIRSFAATYADLKSTPFRSSPEAQLATQKIPELLYEALGLDKATYKIVGSFGKGNWADVPWVCILHRGITESTQNGYYVPMLFSSDMKSMYICIGLGWTQFEEKYGNKIGKEKIKLFCQTLEGSLPDSDKEKRGVINLHARTSTSKGYEYSNITSIQLDINAATHEDIMSALETMLSYYQLLRNTLGADIFYDFFDGQQVDQTEDEDFKSKIRMQSSSMNKAEALKNLISITDLAPPIRRRTLTSHIVRNRIFADYIKERADYICEVCGKKPFIKANGKPYAEADHIEMLGGVGKDHPDNMRCLCAQCHRVVTYGSTKEIESLGPNIR